MAALARDRRRRLHRLRERGQGGDQTPDQVRRWRDKQALAYTFEGLACGTGYTVGVDAFDRGDRHSPITTITVSTSACPDTTAPAAPTGMRQVAATENSVVLSWTAASDNVGVVEYGLYASGVRVSTVSEANATLTNLKCGTKLSDRDRRGRRGRQPLRPGQRVLPHLRLPVQ